MMVRLLNYLISVLPSSCAQSKHVVFYCELDVMVPFTVGAITTSTVPLGERERETPVGVEVAGL